MCSMIFEQDKMVNNIGLLLNRVLIEIDNLDPFSMTQFDASNARDWKRCCEAILAIIELPFSAAAEESVEDMVPKNTNTRGFNMVAHAVQHSERLKLRRIQFLAGVPTIKEKEGDVATYIEMLQEMHKADAILTNKDTSDKLLPMLEGTLC